MKQKNRIKIIIVVLACLLSISLLVLAGTLIYNKLSNAVPAAVTVPDNLITPDEKTGDSDNSDSSSQAQDSSYTPPEVKSSGCYVATAVYGSYDCPQVWTLRRYRDFALAETWHGRAFIHLYYAVSPTIVKWFGKTGWFKKLWRNVLDKKVRRLNMEGYENTPYSDRNW